MAALEVRADVMRCRDVWVYASDLWRACRWMQACDGTTPHYGIALHRPSPPKVATERRWELVMRVGVWMYGSDVWRVGGCKHVIMPYIMTA
jgi:hypothetical protein